MISDTKAFLLSNLGELSENGFSVGVGFNGSEPHWVHSTYPAEWIDHYVENSYLADDPTITHGQMNFGHFLWSDLANTYPGNAVLKGAREFGMPEGNTISLKILGVTSIASCSGPAWTQEQASQAFAAVSALHFIQKPDVPQLTLKPKTKEVLRLLAQGYRDAEIAELLHIKIETVRRRRTMACRVTGTKNTAHLMSFVTQFGLI